MSRFHDDRHIFQPWLRRPIKRDDLNIPERTQSHEKMAFRTFWKTWRRYSLTDRSPGSNVASDQNAIHAAIHQALMSLPEECRKIVILRDIEKLELTDMAHHLGIEERMVKSGLHRGRVLLRRNLRNGSHPDNNG